MSGQTIHLEPIVFQGRVYPSGTQYPGAYEGAFTITIAGNTAYITGFIGRVTIEGRKDLQKKMKAFGVEHIEFTRMEKGIRRATIHREIMERINGSDSSD